MLIIPSHSEPIGGTILSVNKLQMNKSASEVLNNCYHFVRRTEELTFASLGSLLAN